MVLDACDKAKLSSTGPKIRSRLKTMFDWLRSNGHAELTNPAEAGVIRAGRPKNGNHKTEHYRRIKLDNAPKTFQRLQAIAQGNAAISCWLFMALTACRPGEALAALWDQIDLDKKLWINPVSKTEEPLGVPLTSLAIGILETQKKIQRSDLVFANAGGGKLAHSNFAGAPKRAGIEAGTPHSWRSIFRDTAEDHCGFRRETCEAALGHSLGAVEAAYRRERIRPSEERTKLMQAYEDWLTGKTADNVVGLRSA
jgi:integrase